MSRGRKTGGVSDAAAIPPGVPNATSLVLGPLSCRYIRRARDVFREVLIRLVEGDNNNTQYQVGIPKGIPNYKLLARIWGQNPSREKVVITSKLARILIKFG